MIDLTFKRTVEFIGRNGLFKMSGVSVQSSYSDSTLILLPITSRGMIGRCQLEIPIEDVPAVIKALQKEMETVDVPNVVSALQMKR